MRLRRKKNSRRTVRWRRVQPGETNSIRNCTTLPKMGRTSKTSPSESLKVGETQKKVSLWCCWVCVCVCVFGDRQLIEAGPQSADDGGRCAKPLWTPMPTCRFWLKPAATRWGPAPPCGGNDPLEDHLELKKKKRNKKKIKPATAVQNWTSESLGFSSGIESNIQVFLIQWVDWNLQSVKLEANSISHVISKVPY